MKRGKCPDDVERSPAREISILVPSSGDQFHYVTMNRNRSTLNLGRGLNYFCWKHIAAEINKLPKTKTCFPLCKAGRSFRAAGDPLCNWEVTSRTRCDSTYQQATAASVLSYTIRHSKSSYHSTSNRVLSETLKFV